MPDPPPYITGLVILAILVGFTFLYRKAQDLSDRRWWMDIFKHHLSYRASINHVRVVEDTSEYATVEIEAEGTHEFKVYYAANPVSEAKRISCTLGAGQIDWDRES